MNLMAYRFHFELPTHVDDDLLPIYGGKVWIQGDNGEKQCIPFGGVKSCLPKLEFADG